MKKTDVLLPRRAFITAISGMLCGTSLFGWFQDSAPDTKTYQKVKEELSANESKWIEGSDLAKDLTKYFGQGYSCAESILLVSLGYLGKPEELVWAATGFGGGMYQRDLCGFLTGGIMALGFACGTMDKPRREAKESCGEMVKEYWTWWGARAPHRCAQLRSEGTTSQACVSQGLLSAAKIEELIKPIKEKA